MPPLEGTLLEKLRKIEALHAGTTVDGEREAARTGSGGGAAQGVRMLRLIACSALLLLSACSDQLTAQETQADASQVHQDASNVREDASHTHQDASQVLEASDARRDGVHPDGGGPDDAPKATSDAISTATACASLRGCCDGFNIPDSCAQVAASGNGELCVLALVSTESIEPAREPGEQDCSADAAPGPCFLLCPVSTDPVMFGPITTPVCMELSACCSSITVSGGTATCSFVSLEDDGPPCTSALGVFQGLGFCKGISSDAASGS